MPHVIRLAQVRDADAIAALSRQAIEHDLPWAWTPPRLREAIHDPATNVVVATIAGAVIGFGAMEYDEDEAHLLLFAVDAPDRRKGLGSALLAWLEKVALESGLLRIRVEARADNVAALAFYRKHGYVQHEEALGMYYGVEDGVRLVKRLRG